MNEFRIATNKAVELTINNLKEECNEILNYYKNQIKSVYIDLVKDAFKDLPESKLEEWFEVYFYGQLQNNTRRFLNRVEEALHDALYTAESHMINNTVGRARGLEIYNEEVNRANHALREDDFEELIIEFSIFLGRSIYSFHEDREINIPKIEDKIDELKYDIKAMLRTKLSQVLSDYKESTTKHIKKSKEELVDAFDKYLSNEQIKKYNILDFVPIIDLAGYTTYQEGRRLYAKDPKDDSQYEIVIKDDFLQFKGKNICFLCKEQDGQIIRAYLNNDLKQSLGCHKEKGTTTYMLSSDASGESITIQIRENNCEIKQNGVPIKKTEQDKIKDIIGAIKETYPSLYETLLMSSSIKEFLPPEVDNPQKKK